MLQDCAQGDGCPPFGDGFACQDVNEPAQVAGDPCTLDTDCAPGLSCSEEAVCAPFCDLNNDACDDPSDTSFPCWPEGHAAPGDEDVGYRAQPVEPGDDCDPLLQDCAAGAGCDPASVMVFTCRATAAGPGSAGDPCPQHTACQAGLFCGDANECVTVCDINGTDCEDPGLSCIRVYPQGSSPPGLEDAGYCG